MFTTLPQTQCNKRTGLTPGSSWYGEYSHLLLHGDCTLALFSSPGWLTRVSSNHAKSLQHHRKHRLPNILYIAHNRKFKSSCAPMGSTLSQVPTGSSSRHDIKCTGNRTVRNPCRPHRLAGQGSSKLNPPMTTSNNTFTTVAKTRALHYTREAFGLSYFKLVHIIYLHMSLVVAGNFANVRRVRILQSGWSLLDTGCFEYVILLSP